MVSDCESVSSFLNLNPSFPVTFRLSHLAAESSSLVSTLGLVNIPLKSPEFPRAAPPMGEERGLRDQWEPAYLA